MFGKMHMTSSEKLYQVTIYIIVGVFTLMCLFPFIYVIGTSLTSEGELIQRDFFVIIPHHPILRAYQAVLQQSNFGHALLVSIARTVMGVLAALIFAVPGGYILSKEDLPGRAALMIFFIITMILGGGLIPSYLLMEKLNLINNFWVYILPTMGCAFNMLIVKIFVEDIPDEIMESTDIDGATEIQKLIYIAIPLLVPTIFALGLFAAVSHWNSWFDTVLYIRDKRLFTLSYLVKQLLTDIQLSDVTNINLSTLERMTPEGVKMASVVIAAIPILLVYPFLQKYLIYGVYAGSLKG